jgi:hypothetical protein
VPSYYLRYSLGSGKYRTDGRKITKRNCRNRWYKLELTAAEYETKPEDFLA